MQQKYVYSYNGVVNWLKGLVLVNQRGSQPIDAYRSANQLVWRNHVTQNYKVAEAFHSQPLDLSNFLYIMTRERLLLQNKVHAPHKVMRSGKASYITNQLSEQSLKLAEEEMKTALRELTGMLYVISPADGKPLPNLPVAFATNTLYVLERNGLGEDAKQYYESLLIPLLKEKAEYLHAEGISQAVWALANAGLVEDQELWSALKKAIEGKNFAPTFVKNGRWTATTFTTLSRSEHFFQSELSDFAEHLFFRNHLNLFELYNGLKKAHSLNGGLGLAATIGHLESNYGEALLRKNELYQQIEATHDEFRPALRQQLFA